jgi:IS4 transposase
LLFGIFERCDSAREVCDGMAALGGKLNYLGMDAAPAKSTFCDSLNRRSETVFEKLYFALIDYFSPFLSDSRKEDVPFEKFYAFDSTTLSLFTEVLKGVGRNRKDDGRKKGGLKVHMLTDVHADSAKFVKISEAKSHDKNFLKHLILPQGSMIAFDKAYNHYWQFAKWTEEGIFFVCRLKDNAKYEVQDVMSEKTLSKDESGVMKEEHIHLKYKENKKEKTLCLRKVTYRDDKGRVYQFITNNWDITAEEVALIYKYRWTIELVFKKLKQNFQLHFFYSESENGIKTQIWATLIAHLLLTVVKRKSKSNKAFSTIAALIRIHLISHLDLYWVIENGRRSYQKRTKSKNIAPKTVQLSLFDG